MHLFEVIFLGGIFSVAMINHLGWSRSKIWPFNYWNGDLMKYIECIEMIFSSLLELYLYFQGARAGAPTTLQSS